MCKINLIKKEEMKEEKSIWDFSDKFSIWHEDEEYKVECILYEYHYNTLSTDVDSVNLFISEAWDYIDDDDDRHTEDRNYTMDIYNPSVVNLDYFIFWDKIVEILKSLSNYTGVRYPVKLGNDYGYVYKDTVVYL